jgi:hypothetical protein
MNWIEFGCKANQKRLPDDEDDFKIIKTISPTILQFGNAKNG